ncbi:MAG: STAS domain-containing protein [Nitrospinae bacterium]|nr:STAS domain-containing protein [Nitrospinota bacterium]
MSTVKIYQFSSNLLVNTLEQVDTLIAAIKEESPAGGAVISMENVVRIDSSGLGSIFRMQNELKKAGVKYAFSNINSQPIHLFQISMLDSVLSLFDSNESAIEHLTSQKD